MENSLSLERIKYLSKLHQKKFRQEYRQVVVEGKNTIEQLLANGNIPKELYLTEDIDFALNGKDVPMYRVSGKDMKRICDVDSPQAVAALYDIPIFAQRAFRKALYLDRISDPGNLGSIFRSASAFGIDLIVLSPHSCEAFSPKVIRSSLGSVFWIPHFEADADWLTNAVAHRVYADMTGGTPLKAYQYDRKHPCVLVIGAEASGVSPEVRAVCDAIVNIEMSSEMESINASVAAGILCWKLFGTD